MKYIVVEPEINMDLASRIMACLYLKKPECISLECMLREVEGVCRDVEALEYFYVDPVGIAYHYRKLRSGYGALYPVILDDKVEEAEGSQGDGVVRIIHRELNWYGWMPTNIVMDHQQFERIILMLARRINKSLSIAQPIAEGLTPEGVRVALTYGYEVSRKGSSFVMRKKRRETLVITRLIDSGVLTPLMAAYLWLILDLRGSVIIAGPMGSGKTTLLQALLTLIPPSRRVVTIEDTPEITGSTGLWDPLVARPSIDHRHSIDLGKLLVFSMRRRADYIVVGEVRGEEARLLVQASRLGHGTLTTLHAETPEAVFERLSSPPISIPRRLLNNIWSIVIMNPAGPHGKRYVKAIYEVRRGRGEFTSIFSCTPNMCEPSAPGDVAELSARLSNAMDKEVLLVELVARTGFLSRMVSSGIRDVASLSRELVRFYMEAPGEDEEAVVRNSGG